MEETEKPEDTPDEPEPEKEEEASTDEASSDKTMLEKADAIAKNQKIENDRLEKLLDRQEKLAARQALGGETEAGMGAVKKAKQTPEEYAEAALSGELEL